MIFDPGFHIPTVVYICNTSYIFIWTLNFNQPLTKTAKGIRIKEPSSETCDTIKRGRWFIWFWNAALAASETSSTSRRLRLVISSVKNYVTSNYPNLFFPGLLVCKATIMYFLLKGSHLWLDPKINKISVLFHR